jgi:hypothetical protein
MRCPPELRPICPDGTFSVCVGITRVLPYLVMTRFWFPPRARIETESVVEVPAPRVAVTDAGLEGTWATATVPAAAVNRIATHNAIFNVLISPVYDRLLARTTQAEDAIPNKT